MQKDEKRVWTVVYIIAFLFFAAVIIGSLVKPADFTETLYDKMHPASFVNWLGMILLIVGSAGIAGITRLIWGETPAAPKAKYGLWFSLLAILGLFLIWI